MYKIIVSIIFGLLAVFILSACQTSKDLRTNFSGNHQENNLGEIKIAQFMAPDSALLMIAQEKGFYEEVGLKVEMIPCNVGQLCLDALTANKVDVAVAVALNAVTGIKQHSNLKIISNLAAKNNKIIARKDENILISKDLEFKKIGALHAAKLDYFPRKYFKKHNVDVENVEFINLKPNEIVTALIKGDIDAGYLWNPFAYDAISALGDNAISFSDESLLQIFTLITTKDSIDKSELKFNKLIQALEKAAQWFVENKEESIKIVANHIAKNPQDIKKYFSEYHIQLNIDQSLTNLMLDQYQWVNNLEELTVQDEEKIKNIIYPNFISKIE